MNATTFFTVRVWRFHCPECGFGDVEVGQLAADEEIHCVVCLEHDGQHVRLHRWMDREPVEA